MHGSQSLVQMGTAWGGLKRLGRCCHGSACCHNACKKIPSPNSAHRGRHACRACMAEVRQSCSAHGDVWDSKSKLTARADLPGASARCRPCCCCNSSALSLLLQLQWSRSVLSLATRSPRTGERAAGLQVGSAKLFQASRCKPCPLNICAANRLRPRPGKDPPKDHLRDAIHQC